jgi:predicted HTH transcriptional regulator
MADELSELVDDPAERMEVEYKAWLDLSQPKARADLARHIAAIANYGGGAIVFGIDDKGHSCGPAPASFVVDHDVIASITRKYLEPPVHCDVRWTRSTDSVDHPVVQVPPHGATPICARPTGQTQRAKLRVSSRVSTISANPAPRVVQSPRLRSGAT